MDTRDVMKALELASQEQLIAAMASRCDNMVLAVDTNGPLDQVVVVSRGDEAYRLSVMCVNHNSPTLIELVADDEDE